jgi:hypothetical protein
VLCKGLWADTRLKITIIVIKYKSIQVYNKTISSSKISFKISISFILNETNILSVDCGCNQNQSEFVGG